MKKIKLLFLILFMCFLTGCTANYNLTIGDDLVTEETMIIMNNDEYSEFISDNNNKYVSMYVDDEKNLGSDGVTLPIDGVKYYDFNDDSSNNTVYYRGKFSYDDYRRSAIKTLGFKKVMLTNNNDELILSSSTGFTFLYDNLDKIYINITSNYDVLSSNADSVNGNTLTWNITKDNAKDKSISVIYDIGEDEEIKEQTDEPTKEDDKIVEIEDNNKLSSTQIIIIVSSIIGVLLIVFIVLKIKFDKNNRI